MTITDTQARALNQLYTKTLEKMGSIYSEIVDSAIAEMHALNDVYSILHLEPEIDHGSNVGILNYLEEEETPEMFPGIKGMLDNISF